VQALNIGLFEPQAIAQHLQVIEQHRIVEAHQRGMMAQKQQ
jgi:hypothetical protein